MSDFAPIPTKVVYRIWDTFTGDWVTANGRQEWKVKGAAKVAVHANPPIWMRPKSPSNPLGHSLIRRDLYFNEQHRLVVVEVEYTPTVTRLADSE